MTFKLEHAEEAYVWMWLPHATEPVVVGKMVAINGRYHFTYGQSYRARANAMPLSPFELPLQTGTFSPAGLHEMPSCLRDASPDAWGRRLIDYQFPLMNPNELDYLLLSGSDRIGALDFQASAKEYLPRAAQAVTIEAVDPLAKMLEAGEAVSPQLLPALLHGTSIGGARPKCLIEMEGDGYVAKFSLSTDQYAAVQWEYVAMRLAALAHINVAPVILKRLAGRDILAVKRFDRTRLLEGVTRHHMLSALSLLNLHEMEARYAHYQDLADLIRQQFEDPKASLKELFQRLSFNVLIGNTDDHARNHAAFWDGKTLSLTPAYDLSPQLRMGYEAHQAMAIGGTEGNVSTLSNVLSIHQAFLLSKEAAHAIIQNQIETLRQHWEGVCDEAQLTAVERSRMWGRVIHSEYCLQGWSDSANVTPTSAAKVGHC